MEVLLNQPWEGNVKELENAVEHAVAITGIDEINLVSLPSLSCKL